MAAKTITRVTGTKSASGDNEVIAAPTGNQKIVVVFASFQNESATDTTLILKDGSTALQRRLSKQYDTLYVLSDSDDTRLRLSANSALNLNLSGANSIGYNVQYFVE
jgi:hypothetical protein